MRKMILLLLAGAILPGCVVVKRSHDGSLFVGSLFRDAKLARATSNADGLTIIGHEGKGDTATIQAITEAAVKGAVKGAVPVP